MSNMLANKASVFFYNWFTGALMRLNLEKCLKLQRRLKLDFILSTSKYRKLICIKTESRLHFKSNFFSLFKRPSQKRNALAMQLRLSMVRKQ